MIRWYPNPVFTSAYVGFAVVLGSRSNAAFSNVESRLPRFFHPREPPGRYVSQLTATVGDCLIPLLPLPCGGRRTEIKIGEERERERHTLSGFVFGVLPRDVVEFGAVAELLEGFLLFGEFFALGGLVMLFLLQSSVCVWLWCSWGE